MPRGNRNVPHHQNRNFDGTAMEAEFQEAWNRKDWNAIWMLVERACRHVILSKLVGISRNDLDELVMDATITMIRQTKAKLKENPAYRIKKLINAVYHASYFTLYSKNQQFQDKLQYFTDIGRDENGNLQYDE